MSQSRSSVFACPILGLAVLAACSSSSPAYVAPGPTTSNTFGIFPDKVFIGVDDTGKSLGSAPIALTGAAGTVSWTSATTTVATATGNASSGTITAVKAGSSTVTVKAGTKTATIAVTVKTYPAGDKAKGQAEYAAGKCDECHGPSGPDITPSGVGKHDDDEILAAITESKNPEGEAITPEHKFTATAAIVAYMRTLEARTNTPVKDN